ncbi:MAG: gliding motility-associated protein GldE [Chitinophagales bacterium]|nr:gliding motility-associated protein GldE [Chitinophagales bacterium]
MESESLPPSEFLNNIFSFIYLQTNIADNLSYIIAFSVSIIILLFLSAIISGSEVAFYSLKPGQIAELKESDKENHKRIISLLERPRQLLATILIANNFVNVLMIILFNFLMTMVFPNFKEETIALINVAILTPLLVFFGEVSPKVFASQNNLYLAELTSGFFGFLRTIFYPFTWLLVKSGLLIEKRFQNINHEIDLDEIEKAIDLSTTDGSTEEDVNILKGIVHFGNTTVKQIMVPRVDIIALKNTLNYAEILEVVKEAGYSRMPVYEESIDNVKGILYLKDLLNHLEEKEDFNWQNLVRDPFFVHETKKIDDLLREIQENRKHQAIVVDEYGGTKGLVTLEDILEEVLGDIKDEFDFDANTAFKQLSPNSYLMDGKINLMDLCEKLKLPEDDFEEASGGNDTLAGLILQLSGKLPKNGNVITYKNYTFTVLSMDKNRINKVKMVIDEN